MKKLGSTLFFALALVAGTTVFAGVVQAQETSCATADGKAGTRAAPDAECVATAPAAAEPSATVDDEKGPQNTPTVAAKPNSDALDSSMAQGLMGIMRLFAGLLGIAAITLDNVVYFTVVTMGKVINDLSAIGVTWRILRDIGNIALLFGFIAVGVSVILRVDWYGGGYKLLPKLLIVAVALNFSLFVTEAVIDVGNMFATQFYTQINGGDEAAPTEDLTSLTTAISNEGISNKLLNVLGLQNIYGKALEPGTSADVFQADGILLTSFMSIILFIITSFVFFSLSFILIFRFVALVGLIITSPVGFAGRAIPPLEGLAKKWQDQLVKQTISAPTLLLGLYVALAVITDAQFLTGFGFEGGDGWLGVVTGKPQDFVGLFLSYLVAMGLLFGVTALAKNLGAVGADRAMKMAGALSFGATAYGMSALSGSFFGGTRRLAQRYAPTNRLTRGYSRLANFAENRTFDVRRLPGAAGVMAQGGAGVAARGVGASAGGRLRQGRAWLSTTSQASNRTVDQQTRLDNLRTATDAGRLKALLGNISDKELESSAVQDILLKEGSLAAAMLSQTKFDKMMSSDVLSDAQKNKLRDQRTNGLVKHYSNSDELEKLSGAEVGKLSDKVLANNDVHKNLSLKQLNAIMKTDGISNTTADAIGNHFRGNADFNRNLAALIGTNADQAQLLMDYYKI